MATTPPSKETRDTNLDALKSAVQEWGDKEIKRLENEAKFMRAVVQGRGASDTGSKNLATASSLVVNEIDDFFVTGSAS